MSDPIVPTRPGWWWRDDGGGNPTIARVVSGPSDDPWLRFSWGSASRMSFPVSGDGQWLREARLDDVPASEVDALRRELEAERDRLPMIASVILDAYREQTGSLDGWGISRARQRALALVGPDVLREVEGG